MEKGKNPPAVLRRGGFCTCEVLSPSVTLGVMEGDEARGGGKLRKVKEPERGSGIDTLLLQGWEARRAGKPEARMVSVHFGRQIRWCSECTVLHQTGRWQGNGLSYCSAPGGGVGLSKWKSELWSLQMETKQRGQFLKHVGDSVGHWNQLLPALQSQR